MEEDDDGDASRPRARRREATSPGRREARERRARRGRRSDARAEARRSASMGRSMLGGAAARRPTSRAGSWRSSSSRAAWRRRTTAGAGCGSVVGRRQRRRRRRRRPRTWGRRHRRRGQDPGEAVPEQGAEPLQVRGRPCSGTRTSRSGARGPLPCARPVPWAEDFLRRVPVHRGGGEGLLVALAGTSPPGAACGPWGSCGSTGTARDDGEPRAIADATEAWCARA